jgi:hypothetical protein
MLTWGDYIYYGGPLNLQPHQPQWTGFRHQPVQYGDGAGARLRLTHVRQSAAGSGEKMDVTMTKNFAFSESGRKYAQIRFEAFNATNRVTVGAPNTTPTNAAFGTIAAQANTPRRIETGLKLVW